MSFNLEIIYQTVTTCQQIIDYISKMLYHQFAMNTFLKKGNKDEQYRIITIFDEVRRTRGNK
jgi:hypothetical protein